MNEDAQINLADIAAMQSFIAALKAPQNYRDGKTIKRLPARLYQALWRIAEPDNPTTTLLAQRKAAAEAALKYARFRLLDVSLKFQQANAGQRRVSAELLDQWQREAQHWTKVLNGASEALARGGFDVMGAPDSPQWQHAAQTIGKRFDDLEGIADRAKSGGYGPGANQRSFLQHVGQVADFGRAAYENARVDHLAGTKGHDEFKRLLGAADHCTRHRGRPGCIDAAAMGWVIRENLILIGDCACYGACHCVIVSRKSGRDERLRKAGK
jgi:hypothetical protein